VADLAQKFERGAQMHHTDHRSVIALGVTVVEMDTEETALAMDEGGGEGRLLIGIEDMGEVERDVEIGRAGFLYRQKRRSSAPGQQPIGLATSSDLN
jgi:hypothetical protein